jgi:NAD(P)-dependent dehydrogenase (short-subunit alcohol dehydrogenase family)
MSAAYRRIPASGMPELRVLRVRFDFESTPGSSLGSMTDSPVTLITGGGSGIGAATARRLLDQGHRVTITGRGEDRLRTFAEELGEPAGLLTQVGDAADWDAVRTAVDATVEAFGRLDTVVANAATRTSTMSPTAILPPGATWC